MALWAFLKKSNSAPSTLPLPESGGNSSIEAANKSVAAATAQCGKRKRGLYHQYDAKVRLKIAKYALENGNKSAVKIFSAELGHSL